MIFFFCTVFWLFCKYFLVVFVSLRAGVPAALPLCWYISVPPFWLWCCLSTSHPAAVHGFTPTHCAAVGSKSGLGGGAGVCSPGARGRAAQGCSAALWALWPTPPGHKKTFLGLWRLLEGAESVSRMKITRYGCWYVLNTFYLSRVHFFSLFGELCCGGLLF